MTEDIAAYIYALLAHPAYTARYHEELSSREVRVPLSKDPDLFAEAVAFGKRLLWLHCWGERFVPEGERPGQTPRGEAKCVRAVSDDPRDYPDEYKYDPENQELRVGDGAFAPVASEVWDFEVSGLQVVYSWLGYRMRNRRGRKSSPLDDIHPERWGAELTAEFLRLLHVLEHTIAGYPEQAELFERILDGPLFTEDELPTPTPKERKAPKLSRKNPDQPEFGAM